MIASQLFFKCGHHNLKRQFDWKDSSTVQSQKAVSAYLQVRKQIQLFGFAEQFWNVKAKSKHSLPFG